MQVSLADAMVRTASAVNPWSVVYGPAAALVCTADRLGWTIQHATSLTTDEGRKLDLLADPPIVVKRLVAHSVRNWRWRNIAAAHPSLPKQGANVGPVYKLLNSKRCDDEWNPRFIGALKSVLANRQYTQQRCMAAGWVDHGRCLFCLHAAVTGTTIEDKLQAYSSSTIDQEKREQQERLDRVMEAVTEQSKPNWEQTASGKARKTNPKNSNFGSDSDPWNDTPVSREQTASGKRETVKYKDHELDQTTSWTQAEPPLFNSPIPSPPLPKPPPPTSWPPRSRLRARRWEP